jgi:hypothetical protein
MAKGGYWVPTHIEDKKITYSFEHHSPIPLKGNPFLYCRYCGLVYLKNEFTRWCIKKGCNHEYHPQFKQKRNYFTDPKNRKK